MSNPLKYQYHLHTWGGFYNDCHRNIHHYEPGDYFFDTSAERHDYIETLEAISEVLNARVLCITRTEGFCCDVRTCLHRVVEWDGKQYYSTRDMGVNYPYDAAVSFIEWNWTPGFNDYPLGEDFDYEGNEVKVLQEWITGAFTFDKQ